MKTSFLMRFLPVFLSVAVVSFSSCERDDDDPDTPQTPENEQETITTVELSIVGTMSQQTVRWSDPDGPGGDAPVVDTIYLDTTSSYGVSVRFLDESSSETEDITLEVEEEADEHIVCMSSNDAALTFDVQDSDANQLPLGLEWNWTTGEAGVYNLQVQLKHQPDGQKDGSCEPGETDVEVVFPVVIE